MPVVLSGCSHPAKPAENSGAGPMSRVRPGQPGWPSPQDWKSLSDGLDGRLIEVTSPLSACPADPDGCAQVFRDLKNPYYIGDTVALTQTSGWLDAWSSTPSVYAVAAASTADIVRAVDFAREQRLRLVIRGGAHSYLGTSNAPDSLLIWTRHLNTVAVHDSFTPQGCTGTVAAQPAVTVGSGAMWIDVYDAVTTKAGRYAQGGGCATVGVSGFLLGGGFGSFSKNYGLGAAGLLEAEVVTADGQVRIANACNNPDLFWALKGGGGGTFGVVTTLTLRTLELPPYFGSVTGTVKAHSDDAYHRLITTILAFYQQQLFNPHWGEQIQLNADNTVEFKMSVQGLDSAQARAAWQPFLDTIAAAHDFTTPEPVSIHLIAAQHYWDATYLQANHPQAIIHDDRPGSPPGNIYWTGNREEAGIFLYGYQSTWLPAALLTAPRQRALADALFAATRHHRTTLHLNKGLAGAPDAARVEIADTAINPAVSDAFALAIVADGQQPAFPDIASHTPDVTAGRAVAAKITRAMAELRKVAPDAGSYLNETDFFETNWQQSFWGPNYQRLAGVKNRYDPDGLFFVHHGVGSDRWSSDGFTHR